MVMSYPAVGGLAVREVAYYTWHQQQVCGLWVSRVKTALFTLETAACFNGQTGRK